MIFEQKIQFTERGKEIDKIAKVLEQLGVEHVCLEGALFCGDFYELGERRSNGVDIMVLEKDLGKLDVAMQSCGYI